MRATFCVLIVLVFVTFGDAITCKLGEKRCPNEDITFLYATRTIGQTVLDMNNTDEIRELVRPNLQTKILIHGWASLSTEALWDELMAALFQKGDFNVIMVNWAPLSRFPCYLTSASNVEIVGECLAQLIDFLVNEIGIDRTTVHVIGHSLGAHVAGTASRSASTGKLYHVTGLDPAKPLFRSTIYQNFLGLSPTDAEFTDVIHTDAGGFGQAAPHGSVDFYVNGGTKQPLCRNRAYIEQYCDHISAIAYYTESMYTPVGFYGVKCDAFENYEQCKRDHNRLPMGINTPRSSNGVWFVRTAATPPYALGLDL